MAGRFITFEGGEGAGKSTQLRHAAQWLRERGVDVVTTREPGGTERAERLREVLLQRGDEPMPATCELLLMFAARATHLENLVRPAIARGAWVLCDRFTDATYAYQGGGRGIPLAEIETLERWVHPDLQPDRTYLFDLDPAIAAERRRAARAADRFEAEQQAFFIRVRDAYLARAAASGGRFCIVDSAKSIQDIRKILEVDVTSY